MDRPVKTQKEQVTEAPHNEMAERAVIGCLLINPECRYDLGDLRGEDFFQEAQRWAFEAAMSLDAIDQVTLSTELARRGHLEDVGGVSYLSRVVSEVPSSLQASYYAGLVQQAAQARRIISAAGQIAALAYAGQDTEEVLRKATTLLQGIEHHGAKSNLVGPQEYAERTLDHIGDRAREGNAYLGTGWSSLDNLIGGMRPGNLIIVGARPGVGKSQLLQQIVQHHYRGEKAILVASAEMLPEEYGVRNVAMEQHMDIKRLVSGSLTDAEFGQLQPAIAAMSESRQYMLEGRIGVHEIARHARNLADEHGLAFVVVDYLQLLADRHAGYAGDNLRERIGYISGSLKQLALELRVPVLAASQLRREVEYRADRLPTMADLKESGDIEQDADMIILLHRPELSQPGQRVGEMVVMVAKCRQLGQIGTVKLKWHPKSRMYFEEETRRLTPEEERRMEI